MKARYLLDTDWAVAYLRGKEEVKEELKQLQDGGLAISIVSLAELYTGVFSSSNPSKAEEGLDNFLTRVSIIGVDKEISKSFGKENAKLRKRGKTIGDFDLLIAATCLAGGFTLLSNNRRHFEAVENLNLISLV